MGESSFVGVCWMLCVAKAWASQFGTCYCALRVVRVFLIWMEDYSIMIGWGDFICTTRHTSGFTTLIRIKYTYNGN